MEISPYPPKGYRHIDVSPGTTRSDFQNRRVGYKASMLNAALDCSRLRKSSGESIESRPLARRGSPGAKGGPIVWTGIPGSAEGVEVLPAAFLDPAVQAGDLGSPSLRHCSQRLQISCAATSVA